MAILRFMTLTQLEYITAVDTYRHFAAAAKECFVTQPTLSMQIHKLEDELGIKIFDRSKQPVVPTEMGLLVIEQARHVLQEAGKVKEMIQSQKNVVAGSLRLGIIPTLAPYLLPLFITDFIQKYPRVKLIVEELQTEQIIHKLKNETIDTGILVTPLNENGVVELPVFYEPFLAYVSHHHPLYSKTLLKPEELEPREMWLLNQGHCFRNQMLHLCTEKDAGRSHAQFEFESGSLETLKRLVEKEQGYTLLPELATLDLNKSQKQLLRPFEKPYPVREVSLVIRRSFLKRRLIEILKAGILAHVPKSMHAINEGTVVSWR